MLATARWVGRCSKKQEGWVKAAQLCRSAAKALQFQALRRLLAAVAHRATYLRNWNTLVRQAERLQPLSTLGKVEECGADKAPF